MIELDQTLRKWTIDVTEETYDQVQHILNTAKAKQITELKHFCIHAKLLQSVDTGFTKYLAIKKEFLVQWRNYIQSLDLRLFGDENFLLDDSLKFQKLKNLNVYCCNYPDPEYSDRLAEIYSNVISEHAHSLEKLQIDNDNEKFLKPFTNWEKVARHATAPKLKFSRLRKVFDEGLLRFLLKVSENAEVLSLIHLTMHKVQDTQFWFPKLKHLLYSDR